jgi:double-stranded uracil-DNA glycosylase
MDRATVDVYEQRAQEWRDKRPARFIERAAALGVSLPPGVVRLDAGCGAGLHLPALGAPVVALDAAFAMLPLARDVMPDAWCVQADLEALPFRRGSIGASWARASYLHVERAGLPWALLQLHRALAVGAPAEFTFRRGDDDGPIDGDDFAGRFFAHWQPDPLADVLAGAGFEIHECSLEADGDEWINVRATRARTLPDVVGPGMRLLVCGLNPSVYSADLGVGFARRGNRFWPAALRAGIVSRDRDSDHALLHHGIGMTDLVKRATARADELTKDEYRAGAARVERLARWLQPGAVCFVGLAGWRTAVDRTAVAGEQPELFGGVPAYVMPNTSGINASSTPDSLAEHLLRAMELATGGAVTGSR